MVASDATRVEALGPPLIALLASQLSPRSLSCSGDSLYVVSLLQRRFRPADVFLFNCVELTFDLLLDTHILVHWIPRDQNSVCDALARQAASSGTLSVWIHPTILWFGRYWQRIC